MCSPPPRGAHTATRTWKLLHLSGFTQHPKLCWVLLALFLQETFTLSIIPSSGSCCLGHTRCRRAQKATRGQKPQQNKEKSGCLEMASLLLLHLEGFLEYFPLFFFSLMKCNYANEVALIIPHLQHPWRLLGARGSSPAGSSGREGTGGHCTPRGTCAFGYLDQQKSLILNCRETKAPSPH